MAVRFLATAAALAFLGCQEANPVQPHPAPAASPSTSLLDPISSVLKTVTGLLACKPMPEASASATIGPEGGFIRVGPHSLYIPRYALTEAVTITAYAPKDKVNRVHFEPHGLQFRKPAILTMSYANCGIVGWLLPGHIAYVDDDLNILELLSGLPNPFTQTVSAGIEHFSDYADAW